MYAARIGPDGKLLAIEQRLTEDSLGKLVRGTSRSNDVRDLLGPPYQVDTFARLAREVWSYNMYANGYKPMVLYVQFSGDGVLREVMMFDDPRHEGMETP
jgi:hypothetical protein